MTAQGVWAATNVPGNPVYGTRADAEQRALVEAGDPVVFVPFGSTVSDAISAKINAAGLPPTTP